MLLYQQILLTNSARTDQEKLRRTNIFKLGFTEGKK